MSIDTAKPCPTYPPLPFPDSQYRLVSRIRERRNIMLPVTNQDAIDSLIMTLNNKTM